MDSTINSCPVVSVIMPVYNAEKYVGQAIESILNQTFANFEFLIFNDGSTDKTPGIIDGFKDNRIKVFHYDTNHGHLVHLKYGLEIASGEFIARMDADDISIPDRLEKQVECLKNNPDIGVCGSWVKSFGEYKRIIRYPETDDEIKVSLLSHNSFAHPVVMIRKEVLVKNNITYCEDFHTSQDYKMWTNLVPFTKFYNIPEVLLKYRVTVNQVSSKFSHVQRENSKKIWVSQLENIGINPSDEETELHIKIINNNITEIKDLEAIDKWLSILEDRNKNSGFYNQGIFSGFIEKMRKSSISSFAYNNFYLNKKKNLGLVKELLFSDYKFYKYLTSLQKIKFTGKLLFGK